jgi:hypothetical protein
MTRSHLRIAWQCGWLSLLLVVAGCGPAKTEISGTVRYQGKPLTSGHVIVVDADRMPHTSPISPEGSYTAHGIPVGPVHFAVQASNKPDNVVVRKPWRRKPGERRGQSDLANKRKDREPAAEPLLPPHYASPATSGLSTTLKPGPNTFDLDLE